MSKSSYLHGKRSLLFFIIFLLTAPFIRSAAAVDPNFHIYLCFGQSNMEGNAQAETIDKTNVDARFRMLATTNFSSPSRTMGQWYKATPPIVNPVGSLGVTDYFGRTMVAALPEDIKVGVVAVAIGGCAIEMFDKDKYQTQMTDAGNWSTIIANNHYGGNPYKRLIDMARKAQEAGVIKGILLHQGESNNGQQSWLQEVKKIYNDILTDLNLSADSVPLFVGEMLRQEYGGACFGHNSVIAQLPSVVPTAHIIHSNDCEGNGTDAFHFCQTGYRIMGKRYAFAALRTMGLPTVAQTDYTFATGQKKFYMMKKLDEVSNIVMKCGKGQSIPVKATFMDGHTEDVSAETEFRSADLAIDGPLTADDEACGHVEAVFTDFTGKKDSTEFDVDIRFFPFNKESISSIWANLDYNEDTHTFNIEQYGQAGWIYENGVDMSAYKYLVIKLKKKQTCGAQVKIFPQNNIWAAGYSYSIGSKTTVAIPLSKLRYQDNGTTKTVDPSDIYIVDFWCNGGSIVVDDMYLTNNDDYSRTDIPTITNTTTETRDVYNLQGIRIGDTSLWHNLPTGLYIVGGKKVWR